MMSSAFAPAGGKTAIASWLFSKAMDFLLIAVGML
jgi:hypothetical protein